MGATDLLMGRLGPAFDGVEPGASFVLLSATPEGDGADHDRWSDRCGCGPTVTQRAPDLWLIEHSAAGTPEAWELHQTTAHVLGPNRYSESEETR